MSNSIRVLFIPDIGYKLMANTVQEIFYILNSPTPGQFFIVTTTDVWVFDNPLGHTIDGYKPPVLVHDHTGHIQRINEEIAALRKRVHEQQVIPTEGFETGNQES